MIKKINLIRNILVSNLKRLKSPYKLTFALTYRCNLRCKICNIWQIPHRKELSIAEIEKIFANLKNICWLDLTGGEITLREDLADIIGIILKNVKRLTVFHISTNGQPPHRIFSSAKNILRNDLIPVINISIDGPKEINDYLKGKRGAYDSALETFMLLKP